MRVVVIGSGFGGLAAAVRLQQQGHEVTILEKRDKPGGRAYVYEQDGFTFDGGPTIITAPWLIDELFERSGRRTNDYVDLVPIDPFYNIRFEDGSVFQNREGVLPEESRGYYHEYTVTTPGSDDRGARRIVAGACGEMYYTDDHYDSFRLVVLAG